MFKKENLYFLLLLFLFYGCAKPTIAVFTDEEAGTFISEDFVLQKGVYLCLKTTANDSTIQIWFSDKEGTNPAFDTNKDETVTNLGGISPNYSFSSGNLNGTLKFLDKTVTVTLAKNVDPFFNLIDIKCKKQ